MDTISNITIVTAFFDIGRGNWTEDQGHPSYLKRTPDTYLDYFSNLAHFDNPMVVFTSHEYKAVIQKIRKNKTTKVIVVDLKRKFKKIKDKIERIQNSKEFKNKVNSKQLKNPEYWSSDYVLVTNLKSYFVNIAIKELDINTNLIAWVDFGYCRSIDTLSGMDKLDFHLDNNKIHFFTIDKNVNFTEEKVQYAILNNIPYIIGGFILASKDNWLLLYNLVLSCQNTLLKKNIVDDDQGIYLMCILKNRELFQLNYLGKNKWFDVFKKYDKTSKNNFKFGLKKILGFY